MENKGLCIPSHFKYQILKIKMSFTSNAHLGFTMPLCLSRSLTPSNAFSCSHSQGGMIIMLLLSVAITVLSVINVGKSIMFVMTPHLWATSSLMPFIGFLLGYILSAIFRLNGQ